MSDWQWDVDYANQTQQSSSTFSRNCFAYVCDAPAVMFHDGWIQFTVPSSLEECTGKSRLYGNEGHVIRIESILDRGTQEDPDYIVVSTSEKNASSGVYSAGWPFGMKTFGEIRKKK